MDVNEYGASIAYNLMPAGALALRIELVDGGTDNDRARTMTLEMTEAEARVIARSIADYFTWKERVGA
jgi:hypothetical protein